MMSPKKIRLLLIEDNPADAKLIEIMLRDVESQIYELQNKFTFKEGMDAARDQNFDLILLDLSLPDSFGLDTVKNATQQAPDIPIIILTGRDDEEFALEVVRAGAQDYLVKGNINSSLLSRTIRYSIKRKELEAELKASESRLNVIVESNISGIVVLNQDQEIRFVNPAAEKMLGSTRTGLLHKKFFLSFSLKEPSQANIYKTGLLVEVLATETEWGNEPSYLLTLHDITELKQAEERLRIRNHELTRINKALDRFVYIISHDLKKPIANIIGLLGLSEKEMKTASEKAQTIFQKLQFSAMQLKKMVEDLLEDTKKEAIAGKSLDLIEFRKVYDETVASMEQLINNNEASIDVDFSEYPFVAYPYQDLMSVLSNLLTNAVKYHSPERKPKISVKTEKTEQGPVLIVKDNGVGIDTEKEKDRLFQKYQRFSEDGVEGTGLGLWILKEIVEKNGGHIELKSEPAKGSTFKVFF